MWSLSDIQTVSADFTKIHIIMKLKWKQNRSLCGLVRNALLYRVRIAVMTGTPPVKPRHIKPVQEMLKNTQPHCFTTGHTVSKCLKVNFNPLF